MNPFLRVIEALNRHEARYVIVGGFAAVMHGLDRTTRDLDVYVDLEPRQARKAIEALVSLGMKCRVPIDPFLFADPVQRQHWLQQKQALVFTMIDPANPIFAVDLFVEPPMDAERLFGRAKLIRAGDQSFRVCALDDLIAMKSKAGRPQDLMDVEALREIQSERRRADEDGHDEASER